MLEVCLSQSPIKMFNVNYHYNSIKYQCRFKQFTVLQHQKFCIIQLNHQVPDNQTQLYSTFLTFFCSIKCLRKQILFSITSEYAKTFTVTIWSIHIFPLATDKFILHLMSNSYILQFIKYIVTTYKTDYDFLLLLINFIFIIELNSHQKFKAEQKSNIWKSYT